MVATPDLGSGAVRRGGSSPFIRTFYCENSSAGRARPCQGRGRGFESRFSLNLSTCLGGGTGRHAGLKILCPQGRTGSSPVWGTKNAVNHLIFSVFYFKGWLKGWLICGFIFLLIVGIYPIFLFSFPNLAFLVLVIQKNLYYDVCELDGKARA